jgi:DNA-binding CsgD family transcriptional regulator
LVGRDSERAAISTLLAGARVGESHVLVIAGEPGIGKTALLTEARSLVGEARLLRAEGTETERLVPFAGLHQVLRPVLGLVEQIPDRQRAALASALLLDSADAGDAEPNRFAIGAATLSLIALAAEERPVTILIDDAHLLDTPSAEALVFAARRFGSDAVAFVATVRPEDPGAQPWAGLPTLTLGGVDLAAAEQLITRVDGRPRPDQLLRLHRATAGNPLALLEFRENLAGLDAVPAEFPLSVSEQLRRAFLGRAAALSSSGRTALLVAAADSVSAATVYAACAVLQLPGPLLTEAEDAGLVSVRGDRIDFRHPLVRSAVYADADPELRRSVHRALAAVLPRSELHRTAWHLAAGTVDPDEHTAATLDEVAVRADSQGGYAIAAGASERAAELSTDPAFAARRMTTAAEAAWSAGQHDRASRLLDRALALGPGPRLRGHIQELRGAIEARCGSLDRALAIMMEAATTMEQVDVDAAVRLLSDAAHVCFYLAEPGTARVVTDRIGRLLPRTLNDATRALAATATGMALTIRGEGAAGSELIRDAASRLVVPEDLQAERFRLPLRVQSALWLRESSRVRTEIGHAVEEVRAEGALGSLPYLLLQTARNAATTDRWDEAEEAYSEGIRLAGETGQTTDLTLGLAGLACVLARRGKEEACQEAVAACRPAAEQTRMRLAGFWLLFAEGDLSAGAGRTEAAAGHYERLCRDLAERGFDDPDQWPAAELVECDLQLGRQGQAAALAERFAVLARNKAQPWSLARAERGIALCSSDTEAESHFESALSWHARTADRYELARTELAFGARLRRARRRVDARRRLESALAAFEELGAAPWAEQAARELGATGATVRRRDADPTAQLTAQELQVARSLAGGRTTRETAAALFLSPKTVEYHLRHVYLKLGIKSRQELSARFDR